MKFDEFWQLATRELVNQKTLMTIKQSKEFQAQFVAGNIVVTPKTHYKRSIGKTEFQKIWLPFKNNLDPFKPSLYQKDTYHASYILAIIKHILKSEKAQ